VKDWLKAIKENERYISIGLGILILILVADLGLKYFKSVNNPGQTTDQAAQTEVAPEAKTPQQIAAGGLPAEYTIKIGDTLWDISQQAYGTGYKWTEIYNANKETLQSPGILHVGDKISLPNVEVQKTSYTVQKGDSLWGISQNLCGSGFAYPRIATDNQIVNPSVIEPGQVLIVICK
jgi:nucleoid-associated protein YgaU